ncbi:Unknown protein, partial [Striga hermonthica]
KKIRFDSNWIKKEGIGDVIKEAWNQQQEGTPMFRVHEKIKTTRLALLIWNRGIHTNAEHKIKRLSSQLEDMKDLGGNRDWMEWDKLKKELDKAYEQEESFWKQRSRNQWLKEGDRNTRFFHALTLQRRKKNAITRLIDREGEVRESQEEITACVLDFYKLFFTSEGSGRENLLLPLLPQVISEEDNNNLIAKVEESEIKEALFSLNPDKSPGSDGMSPKFFQTYWDIIKQDL